MASKQVVWTVPMEWGWFSLKRICYLAFIIVLTSEYVVELSFWAYVVPSFARVYAVSLPWMSQWDGIHWRITVCFIQRRVMLDIRLFRSVSLPVCRARRTDKASERKITLWDRWGLFSIWAAAALRASVSIFFLICGVLTTCKAESIVCAIWVLYIYTRFTIACCVLCWAICEDVGPRFLGVVLS